jgi:hypothetical protein
VLVAVLRRLGAQVPRAAGRRFNQIAWPAFAVLVATGIWNIRLAVVGAVTRSFALAALFPGVLLAG